MLLTWDAPGYISGRIDAPRGSLLRSTAPNKKEIYLIPLNRRFHDEQTDYSFTVESDWSWDCDFESRPNNIAIRKEKK